eukprot:gene34605-42685_t
MEDSVSGDESVLVQDEEESDDDHKEDGVKTVGYKGRKFRNFDTAVYKSNKWWSSLIVAKTLRIVIHKKMHLEKQAHGAVTSGAEDIQNKLKQEMESRRRLSKEIKDKEKAIDEGRVQAAEKLNGRLDRMGNALEKVSTSLADSGETHDTAVDLTALQNNVNALETKVAGMDAKLDTILAAVLGNK